MAVRVRFAPSPTGQVHIGNIRTAIFNWLFARHHGGKFLLRIEDTDLERSTPEAIRTLLDVMDWLGLNYDEAALSQTSRRAAHQEAAARLLANGHAYRHAKGEGGEALVFRLPIGDSPLVRDAGPIRLELHPEAPVVVDYTGIVMAELSRKGKPAPRECSLAGMRDLRLFDAAGNCLYSLAPELAEVAAGRRRADIAGAVAAAWTRREVFFTDLIKGQMAKPLDGMKDQVVMRSDGTPVFHLANVVDDVFQEITHIVRGDDHVENTYRHILLFAALGVQPPRYGHLPMIVNAQGKPYSKRDGDAFVGDFRAKGYLADALFNYLSLLGWSPGDDREKMTRPELVAAFDLDRVRAAPSQMDMVKLDHINSLYMNELPPETFVAMTRERIAHEPWLQGVDPAYYARVAALMQSRTKNLTDVASWAYFFQAEPSYDDKAVQKALVKPGTVPVLRTVAAQLAELTGSEWTETGIEAAIHGATAAYGIGPGKFNLALRVAATGTNVGAGLYEILLLLGRERTLARLEHAAAQLAGA